MSSCFSPGDNPRNLLRHHPHMAISYLEPGGCKGEEMGISAAAPPPGSSTKKTAGREVGASSTPATGRCSINSVVLLSQVLDVQRRPSTLRSEITTQLISQKIFCAMIVRALRDGARNNSSEIVGCNGRTVIAQIDSWKHATKTVRKQRATKKYTIALKIIPQELFWAIG